METKTEILSQKAANWWSNEIEQNAHNNFVQGLDDFEKQLANKIRDTVAINGMIQRDENGETILKAQRVSFLAKATNENTETSINNEETVEANE